MSPVGRRCCAAQEIRAEQQLCPATQVKIFVLHPAGRRYALQAWFQAWFVATCKKVIL
jgi:hypothetical protein